MKIKSLVIKKNMLYIWLKSVESVDLYHHCARSLVGQYSNVVNKNQYEYEDIELDFSSTGIYYLCGVSKPYRYQNNFHLAFRENKGSSISIDNDTFSCIVEDAESLPITPDFIDYSLPFAKRKEFNTCRNWWFANYFKSNLIKS